jgi:hypothetical protein
VLPDEKIPVMQIMPTPLELPEIFRIMFPVADKVPKSPGPFRIPYIA